MKPSLQPAHPDAGGKALTDLRGLPEIKPSEKVSLDFCRKCGAKEVRREPGTRFHKFFALDPHVCLLCSTRHIRFRFSIQSLLTVCALIALAGVIRYFALNPISFRQSDPARDAAESLARARATAGGLSAFEELMIKKPRTTLDNAAILKLWKARVSPVVVVKMIHTSIPD